MGGVTAWLNAIHRTELPASCYRIAHYLARYFRMAARTGNGAFPSQTRLAEDTGLSPRTTRWALDHLEANGWLHVIHNRGRGRNNRYQPCTQNLSRPCRLCPP